MLVTHELIVHGRCPVDTAFDRYQVTVEAQRLVKVEDILAAVDALPDGIFQEEITQRLASALACKVTSIGYHSGVRTTCVV